MNEMKEFATVQKIEGDMAIIIPCHICEKLCIKEGSKVTIEPFLCNGEDGIRIRMKTQQNIDI